MKALILLNSIEQVPPRQRQHLIVITQSNWQEIYFYLEGKDTDAYLFIHENCPASRLLKLFENYKGNLAVYATTLLDSVVLSRFTKVVNRRKVNPDPKFGQPSEIQTEYNTLLKRV